MSESKIHIVAIGMAATATTCKPACQQLLSGVCRARDVASAVTEDRRMAGTIQRFIGSRRDRCAIVGA